MKDNTSKLHQLLYTAIVDMKKQDTETTRQLTCFDQKIKSGANEQIVSSKIAMILSDYLISHKYKAPKSVIELQKYVVKIAQVYNGKFRPIMWFQ